MGNPAPFTLTIDSSAVEAVSVKHGVAEVAIRLPGCFNFPEPHFAKLVHLAGFGNDDLLVECPTMVTDSPYGVTSKAVVGYSNAAFNYPVLLHFPRIGISHTLRVSKLFKEDAKHPTRAKTKRFSDADIAGIKKNLFIIMHITPNRWHMK